MNQYIDMTTTEVTKEKRSIWYAEDMNLQVYSATNLARIRKEKGFSQGGLANASDVSKSMIAKLEQNITSPSAEMLKKIGEALDVYFVVVWGDLDENSSIIFRNK